MHSGFLVRTVSVYSFATAKISWTSAVRVGLISCGQVGFVMVCLEPLSCHSASTSPLTEQGKKLHITLHTRADSI